jgi:hypothetical protein
VEEIAPAIATPLRFHWYEGVGEGVPNTDAGTAVSTWPTVSVPLIVGVPWVGMEEVVLCCMTSVIGEIIVEGVKVTEHCRVEDWAVKARFVNLATPNVGLDVVVVPPSGVVQFVPVTAPADTVLVAVVTVLPPESRIVNQGCVENADPLVAFGTLN